MHLFRWDLDRTYLATDIHSVRGMLRAAVETADQKRTVPGATELMRGLLDRDDDARVAILSGSPTQMRAVLEEKLTLDGIRFESLVLKDNLRNLRLGRFRAVRGQVGYKLPQLLAQRLAEPRQLRETLFGDDAEVDALIYALYANLLAGRADGHVLEAVLRAGGAYDDQVRAAQRSLGRLEPAEAVEDIFIHVDRRLPLRETQRLGAPVRVVFSWFQAALVLFHRGRLGHDAVVDVARRCSTESGLAPRRLAALVQDAVARHLVDAEEARAALDDPRLEDLVEPVERALSRLGPPPPKADEPSEPDYLGFLEASEAWRGVDA